MDQAPEAENTGKKTMLESLRFLPPAQKAVWACAFVVFAAGLSTIAGALPGFGFLRSLFPGGQPMSPVTAVCMILFALQLSFILVYEKNGRIHPALNLPASFAALIGAIVTFIYVIELKEGPLHIASVPALDALWHICSSVNFYTAVLIVVFSSALLLIGTGGGLQAGISHVLALPSFMAGYFIVISYILRVESIHEFLGVKVAFSTGLGFCALALGIFFLRPATWLMGVFTGEKFGSVIMRRMLPGFMLAPAVIGWFRLQGERTGFFTSEVGVVAVLMTYTVSFLFMLWLNARTINRADGERRAAEDAHIRAENILNQAQKVAHLGSWELDLINNRLYWSDEIYNIFGLKPREFGATYEAFLERVHPDDRGMVNEAYSNSLKENRDSYEVEHRVVRRDNGGVRVVHEKCEHYRGNDGGIIRSVGMVHDITERKLAEEKLSESRRKLQDVYASMNDGLALHDIVYDAGGAAIDYVITEVNPAFEKITGLEKSGAEGKKASELYGTNSPPYLDVYSKTASGGPPVSFEIYFQPMKKHFSISVFSHGPGKFATVFQDVTERVQAKEKIEAINEELTAMNEELTSMNEELSVSVETQGAAEEELRRSMQRFELLSGTSSALLRSKDPHKDVERLYHKVMKMLDCQVFFNYLTDGGPENLRLNVYLGIPEAEAEKIRRLENSPDACAYVARSGEPFIAGNIQNSSDERVKLAGSFGIKAYACHPISGSGGKAAGTLSFGTRSRNFFSADDIAMMKAVTDEVAAALLRTEAELELKKSHGALEERVKERTAQLTVERKRLFDVMETLPVYVALLGADHKLAYANKFFRDRFGEGRDNLCHRMMFGSAASCENCGVMDVLGTNKSHNWKWSGPDRREYDIYDFSFKEADGTQQILEMGIDITDSSRAREAMIEAQRQVEQAKRLADIGTLASTVAHELRNPLATIVAAVYNIRLRAKDPGMTRSLDNIHKKVKESDRIIDNLLFYSKLKAPVYEDAPIYDILEESADELLTRANGTVLITRGFDGLKGVTIGADPVQIREVFANLLNNAFQAAPKDGGLIELSGRLDNNLVKIMVKDNGAGIEKDILEKVFDPFFTTKAKGTGLGLSVCRQIIAGHRGAIWMESEQGSGACARITLPVKAELNG